MKVTLMNVWKNSKTIYALNHCKVWWRRLLVSWVESIWSLCLV